MKKTLYLTTLILLLISVISLVACGDSGRQRAPQNSGNEAQAALAEDTTQQSDPAHGKELFVGTCSACHGPAGEGIEGLGKDMTSSDFIASNSDAELIEFIKVGRDPSDPLNTTGVAMPPKGGNPALSDQDLQDIVAFIRSIQK